MASYDRNEDVNMSMNIDAEETTAPPGRSTAVTRMGSSVPKDVRQTGAQEPENEDREHEQNGNEETLEHDTSFESMDSNQRDEAQQQSIPSTTVILKIDVPWDQTYEIKTDDVGDEWFCATGIEQRTVYHSDIRYDLEHSSERSVPRGGRHYTSKLGAGTDDTTSYHPLFDFCGRDRAERPDSLFCLYKPSTKHYEEPTQYLVWNGRVVLDYKREAIRAFDIPLTISSKIGYEAARLEAMIRSDDRIKFSDIMARILRRGVLSNRVKTYRNSLNMCLVRFRIQARLLSFDVRGNNTLKNYLLSTMTPEMVAKNTTRGLADLVEGSDEKAFIELLNKGSKKVNSKQSSRKGKNEEKRRRDLKAQLTRAEAWAQALTAWEAQIPIPAPSIHGDLDCTAVESIVAFKLASMRQYRRDGRLAFEGPFMLDNTAPNYPFEIPGMKEFFGGQMKSGGDGLADPNDPYGLLGSPTVTEGQSCLVDFLLEPARMQYRMLTLVDDGSGVYRPIFITNPQESYWRQLEALQSAFEETFRDIHAEHAGDPPELFGLLRLDQYNMVWNGIQVPYLTLIGQSLERCRTTLARWQRQQREKYRANLCRLQRKLEDDETDDGGLDEDEGQDTEMVEEREDGKDDVEMEGEVQDVGEDELEDEEELFEDERS